MCVDCFRPRVFECDRSIEDEVAIGAVGIEAEVAEAFELESAQAIGPGGFVGELLGQALFKAATGENCQ